MTVVEILRYIIKIELNCTDEDCQCSGEFIHLLQKLLVPVYDVSSCI